jgi:hypothetical protein
MSFVDVILGIKPIRKLGDWKYYKTHLMRRKGRRTEVDW